VVCQIDIMSEILMTWSNLTTRPVKRGEVAMTTHKRASGFVILLILAFSVSAFAAPSDANFKKGVEYYKSGNNADAIKEFEQAVQANPKNPAALSWLGYLLLKEQRAADAVAYLQSASELSPKDAEVWNNLGTAYLIIGENEKAVEAYTQVLKLRPSSADALYNLANAKLKLNNLAEAEKLFREAAAIKPNDTNILNNLGLTLQRQNKLDDAIATFKTAVEVDPNNDTLLLNLGTALKAKGDKAEAIKVFEQLVKLNKNLYYAHIALGELLSADESKTDVALEHYKQAVKIQPNEFAPNYNMGVLLARQGKHGAAIDAYNAALLARPTDAETMTNLGWSLYKAGKPADAIKQLKVVVEQNPDYLAAHKRLAMIYTYEKDKAVNQALRQSYIDGGITEWTQVIRLDKKEVAAHVNLANFYLDVRDLEKAEAQYRAALGLEPNNPQSRLGLGLVLVEQNKLDEAIDLFRNLTKSHPKLSAAYNNLGVALEKKGLIEEAKVQYKKALELDPAYSDAKFNLDRLAGIPKP